MTTIPDSWNRDCPQKQVRVEVAEYVEPDFAARGTTRDVLPSTLEFVEIPTSRVESRFTKGDKASILRNTRVDFPTEWDGKNVREFVKEYGNAPFTIGRVSYKNDAGNWVKTHCGYIAGIGGTTNELESKFWIYDFNKVLDDVGVDESFADPTVFDIMERIGKIIVDQTPIPLTDIIVSPPNYERVSEGTITQLVENFSTERQKDVYRAVTERGESEKPQFLDSDDVKVQTVGKRPGDVVDTGPSEELGFAAEALSKKKVPSSVAQKFLENTLGIGVKKFQSNRDTLIDICTWLQKRAELHWHFEPTGNGVALVFHSMPPRRNFVGDGVAEDIQSGDVVDTYVDANAYSAFNTMDILYNNALYEINPVNQVTVRGETSPSGFGGSAFEAAPFVDAPQTLRGDTYPIVTARADPLYRAAGSTAVEGETIDVDAQSMDSAKMQAVRELRELVTNRSQGEIRSRGEPYIQPWDTIDAYEQCNEIVDATNFPVRYEVNEVAHIQKMGGVWQTQLDVTVFLSNVQISFPVETTGQLN